VYLPKGAYKDLKRRAEKERRSISMQVVLYIERGLKRDSKE
jgi:CopG-like RHH_1 or ribbon-helix-helix domain, RHH_5